jgi:tRNA G37 N-methylase Trm5
MSEIIKLNAVEERIIVIRNTPVLLDSDVAWLYGVETKEINQAVKNNPKKFPKGYVLKLDNKEFNDLRSKILTANMAKTRVNPNAFTEQGLYMLATILKGDKAIDTTIEIIETFTKFRKLARIVNDLYNTSNETQQKSLVQKGWDILSDILSNDMQVTDLETTYEINAAIFKFKRTIKQKK